jgi:methionyl-tRNA formyltransferase
MRIAYFGAGAFGLPTLEWLFAGGEHELAGVVTQPDRPAGRGQTLTPSPVGAWMAKHRPETPVLKIERVNEPGATAEIRSLFGPGGAHRVDAWLVIAFGQKLSKELLAGVTAMNLHASLLPRWRGAAPINAAVLAGDGETGNTVITLAERMDAGLMLGQSRRAIEPGQTAGELHDLLALDGPGLVRDVLAAVAERGVAGVGKPQDEALATRAGKFSKADGWVDLGEGAEACRRRVHGLTPWPGVTVRLRGEGLKLLRTAVVPGAGGGAAAGVLVDAPGGVVACGGGDGLRMLEVQPSGGRAMSWAEFARGRRVQAGERIEGGRDERERG